MMNIDKLPQSDELSHAQFLTRSTDQETQDNNEFMLPKVIPASNIEPSSSSLGNWLKQTRIAQHLEPHDVANRLNVGTQIIHDIENDAFNQLGAPVFVRNYLTRYAELLRLPEPEILNRYKELGIDQPPPLKVTRPVTSTPQVGNLRWLTYPIMFALVIWLGWLGVDRLSNRFTLFDSTPEIATTAAENATFALPGQTAVPNPANSGNPLAAGENQIEQNITLIDPANALTEPAPAAVTSANALDLSQQALTPLAVVSNSSTDETSANNIELVVAQSATDDKQALTADILEANTEALTTAANVSENHQLILQVSADCWVEIKDADGQRLLYGTVSANSQRVLAGRAPFSITLGNSTAAQLSLNGQPVDTALYHKPGGVSRFVLAADAPISG